MAFRWNQRHGITILIGAILILGGTFWFKKSFFQREKQLSSGLPGDPATLAERDRQVLEKLPTKSGYTPGEAYAAIVRLGESPDPRAFENALRYIDWPEKYIREASAEALGPARDERSTKALQTLAADPDRTVRLAAIRALAQNPTEQRLQALKKLNALSSLTDFERVAVTASLGQVRRRLVPGSAENEVKTLLKFSRSEQTQLATEALTRAVELAPNHPEVLKIVRERIPKPGHDSFRVIAIRSLAARRDRWLTTELHRLTADPSAPVRQAAIETVRQLCPTDRWPILLAVAAHESNPQVLLAALRGAVEIREPRATEFFQALTQRKLSKEVSLEIAEAQKALTHQGPNGSCAGR